MRQEVDKEEKMKGRRRENRKGERRELIFYREVGLLK